VHGELIRVEKVLQLSKACKCKKTAFLLCLNELGAKVALFYKKYLKTFGRTIKDA